MEVIKVKGEDTKEALVQAVKVLGEGGIVCYPTETFYALGARFDDPAALSRLFELKSRPADKPVSLIVGTDVSLPLVTEEISTAARGLITACWPGPLTILFKARKGLPEQVVLDGKVAVRVPGGSFALQLARALTFPITATSANPSGGEASSDAKMVLGYFPEGIDLLIDAGPTTGGRPSTVVDASGEEIKVIRPGAQDISQCLNQREAAE
jgi:L-threonylcarbamoyladenylate synthase